MASHAGSPHVAGHKTAVTNGGWGVALGVCALAVALWASAWYIHRTTFEDPRDPLSPGSETTVRGHGAAGGHGGGDDHGAAADHDAAAPSSH